MEQRYGTDPSRRYGTGVWNEGMERVWSRSLFRTSYFDLPPYIYIYLLYPSYNPILPYSTIKFTWNFQKKGCVISIMLYPLKTVATESSCRTVEPRILAPGPMDLVEDLGRPWKSLHPQWDQWKKTSLNLWSYRAFKWILNLFDPFCVPSLLPSFDYLFVVGHRHPDPPSQAFECAPMPQTCHRMLEMQALDCCKYCGAKHMMVVSQPVCSRVAI